MWTDTKSSKETEKLAMKSLPTAPTHTFYELSLPIGKWGRSKRGSTLCWSLLQRPKFPAWIITLVSKGAAALRHRMRFSSNNVWEVWKSRLTLKWTGRFYLRQPTHSRSFTTGGHGYTPLCYLVAIKDFKERAVNTLALRLTTWPSDALLVESCNRKWTEDYSDHNQSGVRKRASHRRILACRRIHRPFRDKC